MEIEVGEYIRTDKGIISKINSGVDIDMIEFENAIIGNIVKHSKNIIDLIQEGDYVNGEYVKEIIQYESEKCIIAFIGIIGEEAIKTILTKEQYEKNSYKIGE